MQMSAVAEPPNHRQGLVVLGVLITAPELLTESRAQLRAVRAALKLRQSSVTLSSIQVPVPQPTPLRTARAMAGKMAA